MFSFFRKRLGAFATWPGRVRRRAFQGRSSADNRRQAVRAVEPLESRAPLDGSGVLWGNAAELTLSFAPDGTDIAGRSSELFARMSSLASESDWKGAILRAFQTWAVETNADLGVVPDGGQPFGSPAAQRRDARFGDVRIGAIPLPLDVLAVSIPSDTLIAGSWVGDVLFNSNAAFAGLSDVFSVALHEAGHVFGLPHNDDVASPMHVHGISPVTAPAPSDIAALRARFGARTPDANETDHETPGLVDNDSLAHATPLKLTKTPGHEEGTGPSIVYGDVSSGADADYYFLPEVSGYAGTVSFSVRSEGISLLAPSLTIYDETGTLLAEATSTSAAGDWLTLQIDRLSDDGGYYVRVRGATGDVLARGGYSLVATWDGILLADPARIAAVAGGAYRHLSQQQLQQFFEKSQPDLLNDDHHGDDDVESSAELDTAAGFQTRTRYVALGSIADVTDRDYYNLTSPDVLPAGSTLTVLVHSLEAARLIPRVRVHDENDGLVPIQILVNGGGDLVVQAVGVQADKDYFVEVASGDPYGIFNKGNYELTATFAGAQPVPTTFATGTLTPGEPRVGHTLYVGQTQLFHLLLSVDGTPTTSPTSALAVVYDSAGQIVLRLSTPVGQTRSAGSVLLEPGEYTVAVAGQSLDGSLPPAIDFTLSGVGVSDPIGPEPQDPGGTPLYECPDNPGTFCYPGGVTTTDPFLWSGPPQALPELPPLDATQRTSLLLGDWWYWVWNIGVSKPPSAVPDHYTTTVGATLATTSSGGVLANDTQPQGDPLTALLQTPTTHGTLTLAYDGSFTYQPQTGFQGTDRFSYVVTDFRGLSDPVVVTLVTTTSTGLTGDFNADGRVDLIDLALLQTQFGATGAAGALTGDLNADGIVNRADVALITANYGRMISPQPAPAAAVIARVVPLRASHAAEPRRSVVISVQASRVNRKPKWQKSSSTIPGSTTPSFTRFDNSSRRVRQK